MSDSEKPSAGLTQFPDPTLGRGSRRVSAPWRSHPHSLDKASPKEASGGGCGNASTMWDMAGNSGPPHLKGLGPFPRKGPTHQLDTCYFLRSHLGKDLLIQHNRSLMPSFCFFRCDHGWKATCCLEFCRRTDTLGYAKSSYLPIFCYRNTL